MICYSLKKEGETNEKLLLRYKKCFFQTRTANKLKTTQNHTRNLSKRKIREKAIIREYYRALAK
jgi:AAA+ superfamily predicted ATPase